MQNYSKPTSLIGHGLFDDEGKLWGSVSSPIQKWKEGDYVEQSSIDIWHAICVAAKSACSLANVSGNEVSGMGFAATCSLVAVDVDGSPVTVSLSGDFRRNVIVWMDHRAVKQAEKINSSKSPALQYWSGALSPEIQSPKHLWVKENLQESWSMAFRWMDLSDWLSHRATGDDTCGLCTYVCKGTYLGHSQTQMINENDSRNMKACGWDDDFWKEIGLGDLVDRHHAEMGRSVVFPGHPLGSGLTSSAAKELGLVAGIPVGTSLSEAQVGGIGGIESASVSRSEAAEGDDAFDGIWLYQHSEKLMEYQNKRGGKVRLQSILMPLSEFNHEEKGDAWYAMELALSLEKLNNEKLLKLHAVADRNNDVHLLVFVDGEFLANKSKPSRRSLNM